EFSDEVLQRAAEEIRMLVPHQVVSSSDMKDLLYPRHIPFWREGEVFFVHARHALRVLAESGFRVEVLRPDNAPMGALETVAEVVLDPSWSMTDWRELPEQPEEGEALRVGNFALLKDGSVAFGFIHEPLRSFPISGGQGRRHKLGDYFVFVEDDT